MESTGCESSILPPEVIKHPFLTNVAVEDLGNPEDCYGGTRGAFNSDKRDLKELNVLAR